jgi:glucokinase
VSDLRLIGDIGGTNARFAIAQGGRYDRLRHVEVDQYPSLQDALSGYLQGLPAGCRSTRVCGGCQLPTSDRII